jgi:hypothetical protein
MNKFNLLVVVDLSNVRTIGMTMAATSNNPITIPATNLAIQGHFVGMTAAAARFRDLERLQKNRN